MRRSPLTARAVAALLTGAAILPVVAGLAAPPAQAQQRHELFKPGVDHATASAAEQAVSRPPLHERLQGRTYPVTASPEAQRFYDQGVTLAWGFNHAEARRAFREGQRLDPACAMCFWGEAFVLGPNINDGMRAWAVAPAAAAVARAEELKRRVTPRERALIEALAKRYSTDPAADRAALNAAWAEAMRSVAADYPEDPDVLALYADALMNLQPWDYWEADGVSPRGAAAEIVATLEAALAVDPSHPAAAHLYIHAVEASATPERAEPYADLLRETAPATGHLVHMPSHIYARVGRHGDSLEVNRAAVAADEAMLAEIGEAASPLYRYGYYPHNVHFLLMAAHFSGAKDDAIAAAEKLAEITSREVSRELAWVQAIRTAPYTAHAQFSDADAVLALPEASLPFVEAFRRYARAMALAREGRTDAAADEAAAIAHIMEEADLSGLEAQYLPARAVLSVALLSARAQLARAAGELSEAERLIREAIELEAGIGYMEPPYWYSPVQQSLGAILLAQGRAEEAAEAFRAALAKQANNGWALWGLAEAERAAGRADAAADAERTLAEVWLGPRDLLTLDRL